VRGHVSRDCEDGPEPHGNLHRLDTVAEEQAPSPIGPTRPAEQDLPNQALLRFFALNGAEGPRGDATLTLYSPAYDAGGERNDELCASIPGPFFAECGGPGGGAKVGGGEGYVHIHAGIHGIGDLIPAMRDWRNPVAQITIRRVR